MAGDSTFFKKNFLFRGTVNATKGAGLISCNVKMKSNNFLIRARKNDKWKDTAYQENTKTDFFTNNYTF